MKKRRITAAVVSLSLAVSSLPAFARDGVSSPATRGDVVQMLLNAADYYNPGVVKTDIIKGYEDGSLHEERGVTRAEALVMLERAFGDLPEPVGQNARAAFPAETFNDVPEWAKTELKDVFDAGIVAGTAENTFSPDDPVTKEQMDLFIKRVYALFGTNLKDDFYAAVNKQALDTLEIPNGYTQNGGIYKMDVTTDNQVAELIDEIDASEPKSGTKEQKVKTMYRNLMDMDARDKLGVEPIKKYIDAVDKVKNVKELSKTVNEINDEAAMSILSSFVLSDDILDSSRYSVYFMPSSPLLEKDYYESGTELEAFRSYITEIFTIAGEDEPEKKADAVIDYETRLAEAELDISEQRNVDKIYNTVTMDDIKAAFPDMDIDGALKVSGFKTPDEVIINDMGLFNEAAELYNDENIDMLKAYVKYRIINDWSYDLGSDLLEANDKLDKVMYGVEGTTVRQRAIGDLKAYMEPYLSELYAERYFSPEQKADVEHMVKDIIAFYKERLKKIDWMTETTKEKALLKLDKMGVKIGYPDEYENYLDDAEIRSIEDGGGPVENIININKTLRAAQAPMQYEPVDKSAWLCETFIVNAFYNPVSNDITFPAAILQAPLYDPNASYESNLGGIGYVIAHEITHAFDNNGSQFDENGNAADWWTAEDKTAFDALCDEMAGFYDGQESAPGIAANGELTLGENIADNGAISCVTEIVAGLDDPDFKALFEAAAHSWEFAAPREYLSYLALSDEHSPAKLRINRVFQNNQRFYDTYGITDGDGMYVAPEDRVKIW